MTPFYGPGSWVIELAQGPCGSGGSRYSWLCSINRRAVTRQEGETRTISVHWFKYKGDNWRPFETLDLDTATEPGVYIIWHTGNPGKVVYVGQRDVAERISAHRADSRILGYRTSGELRVTWASVPANQRDGVERHLVTPLVTVAAWPARIASIVSTSFMY